MDKLIVSSVIYVLLFFDPQGQTKLRRFLKFDVASLIMTIGLAYDTFMNSWRLEEHTLTFLSPSSLRLISLGWFVNPQLICLQQNQLDCQVNNWVGYALSEVVSFIHVVSISCGFPCLTARCQVFLCGRQRSCLSLRSYYSVSLNVESDEALCWHVVDV